MNNILDHWREVGFQQLLRDYMTRQIYSFTTFERTIMGDELHYYDLPATSDHRCSVMLKNRMQCNNRSTIAIVPMEQGPANSYICNHHFQVERAINEARGTKYIYHDVTGSEASDVDKEYKPPQK